MLCDNRIPFKYFSFKLSTMLSFLIRGPWRSIRKEVFTHSFPGAARCVGGVAVRTSVELCHSHKLRAHGSTETLQSHPGLMQPPHVPQLGNQQPTPPAGRRIPSEGNNVTPWDSEGSTLLLFSLQNKNGMGSRGCPPIWADLLVPACSPGDWYMPPLAWKEAGNFSLLSGLKPHTFFKVLTPALRSESPSRFVLSWALSLSPRVMQHFLICHSYSFIIVWSFLILNFGYFIHHVVSKSCFNPD